MNDQKTNSLEESRQKLIEEAARQYLIDMISLGEYEKVIERIQKIETFEELIACKEMITDEKSLDAGGIDGHELITGDKKDHYTIFSYQNISGSILHRTGKFITVFGEKTITITENDLPMQETVLNITSIFGSTVLYVPENVIIVNCIKNIVGDIWIDRMIKNNSDSMNRKVIIVCGMSAMGEVIVKTTKEKMTVKGKIKNTIKYIKGLFGKSSF